MSLRDLNYKGDCIFELNFQILCLGSMYKKALFIHTPHV